ncbi:hypothetical protein HAX54_011589 [Datura stramonium]|uniref:TF-B3 domain-containing protein n=1 Tax=Datura stramonium TaxID=4076 RepID=A0ABS8TK13_DATST|nr:hypothetical protein [Datura stramonium]
MPTIRLFGKDIEMKVEEKIIKLFGKRISPQTALNNNKKLQHYNRCIILPPPYMSAAIHFVGGSQPVYIGRKRAEESDVNLNLSRFFIPATYITKLLNDLNALDREKMNDKGLKVSVMDPQGNFHSMNFTRWKSLRRFVFNRGWNKLVLDNGLQKGDTVDLWHFKTPSVQPCFAINIIKNN